jgi:hypothetical protein
VTVPQPHEAVVGRGPGAWKPSPRGYNTAQGRIPTTSLQYVPPASDERLAGRSLGSLSQHSSQQSLPMGIGSRACAEHKSHASRSGYERPKNV